MLFLHVGYWVQKKLNDKWYFVAKYPKFDIFNVLKIFRDVRGVTFSADFLMLFNIGITVYQKSEISKIWKVLISDKNGLI